MMRYKFLTILAITVFLSAPVLAQDSPSLNVATRERVVEGVASRIEASFYDSEMAGEIAEDLRTRLSAGEFDDADNAASLASQLTEILHPSDSHFSVRYFGPPPPSSGGAAPNRPAGSPSAAGRRDNFGFREVSILPGNVGYIDMRQFYPTQIGGDTALAALNFIQNTDAVIFDMRQNGGGSPSMVQFLISHFLDPNARTVINTFRSSNRDYPGELLSLSYLPGEARPEVPLYVLTSGRTGSAGEAFPYHLQAMERATIVGETTYGAGNPGGYMPVGDGFRVFVSNSRTQNPFTGTNWEGVGVMPDIAVPAADARDAALILAYDAILETAEDAGHRRSVEWARDAINIRNNPPVFDLESNLDILGHYDEREIYLEDGNIYYRRGRQPGRRLIYLNDDLFLIEEMENLRLSVQRDNGHVVSLTFHRANGQSMVVMRDAD